MEQIYYWAYTAAWTDVNGLKFNVALKSAIDYFDTYGIKPYSESEYAKFQTYLARPTGLSGTSLRKGINQLVKIGFLKPLMQGYIPEAKEFVEATTERRKSNILSKVVYHDSNLQNSMSEPDYHTALQIKFLLNTLEEVGSLNKRAIVSLMTIDINDYKKGFLTKEELDKQYALVDDNDFINRKYNQISHFRSLLGKLDGLKVHDGSIYFKTDAERLFGDEGGRKNVRDPYLQRIYKSELEEESCIHYKCDTPKCMLEGVSHPVLIASHIKPWAACEERTETL